MSLYCQLPFGKFHRGNPEVIRLAEAIGRTPSSVAMKLCNLASLDTYHQERGVKGLSAASRSDREIWNEFHADWETLAGQSEQLREQYKICDEPTDVEQPDPTQPNETERTVRVRLTQGFFRKTILASYGSQCCVTGIPVPSLLVASHILPWSTHPEHRVNPHNGLCLNTLHDKAFDRGLITFDEAFRLVLSPQLNEATTNQVLNDSFRRFEGQTLQLPEKFRPLGEFLAVHREAVFQE